MRGLWVVAEGSSSMEILGLVFTEQKRLAERGHRAAGATCPAHITAPCGDLANLSLKTLLLKMWGAGQPITWELLRNADSRASPRSR